MTISAVFEQIVDPALVEEAVQASLQRWFLTYLAEVERQRGIPARSLPDIRSWVAHDDVERWPEEQLPAVVVYCPGLEGTPNVDGARKYTANWLVGIAVVTSAATMADARKLSRQYVATVRAIMVQKPDQNGLAQGTEWLDEQYEDIIPPESERTMAAGRSLFRVRVPQTVTGRTGPRNPDPPPDPYVPPGDWPLAQTVDVTVQEES